MYGALYGQHPMIQGIALLQDLKLGQYVKLAPRVTFLMQIMGKCSAFIGVYPVLTNLIIGTVVGAILNYVMMLSIIESNRDGMYSALGIFFSPLTLCSLLALLSISGTRLWSGQNAQGYNSNAISWGALGPQMFGPGATYRMVPISLAIGVVLPLPFVLAVSANLHYTSPHAILNTLSSFSTTSGLRLASRTSTPPSSCSTLATCPLVSTPP